MWQWEESDSGDSQDACHKNEAFVIGQAGICFRSDRVDLKANNHLKALVIGRPRYAVDGPLTRDLDNRMLASHL